jgi:hypothetical protein
MATIRRTVIMRGPRGLCNTRTEQNTHTRESHSTGLVAPTRHLRNCFLGKVIVLLFFFLI